MTELSRIARMPFFSYGFRTFFLSGSVWALVSMLLWILWVSGTGGFLLTYGGFAWHAHELLLGYGSAVLAGFLLTAIPNWTGRAPVQGPVLAALWMLWLVGRLAMLCAEQLGYVAAAVLDSAFLVVLVPLVVRELVLGKNQRNLRVAGLIGLLALVNIGFHIEYLNAGYPDYTLRAAVAVFVILLTMIGGRIIPAFTRNWLVKHGKTQRLPKMFGRFDVATLTVSVAALLVWIAMPLGPVTGGLLLLAGALQLIRLSRWGGLQTFREPLVIILHAGYLFVGVGFLLASAAAFEIAAIIPRAAVHGWTTGAIGIMTLAVMTRASRGHAGFPLIAPLGTQLIYLLILVATLLRVTQIMLPDLNGALQASAAVAWLGAFGLFVVCYGPMLVRTQRGT